jgi:hypothetical protein
MAKHRIHIENLRIKLPRTMSGDAVGIANGLGREIMKGIADVSCGKSGELRIDRISAPVIRRAVGKADTQKRAAEEISAQIKKRLGWETN